jgi:hypothetical protein
MTAWLTRATAATAVAALLATGGAVSAVAAPADGSNWPHPTEAGLIDCNFTGPFKDEYGHGVFDQVDVSSVPRRRWNCSAFEITFAVFRYDSDAKAKQAQDRAGTWHRDFAEGHGCGADLDPGGCGTVRGVGSGHVFSASDSVNFGVYTGIPLVTGQDRSGWMMGAWARTGNYVVYAEQTSYLYAGGYFTAADMVAAAKYVANTPPTGLDYAKAPSSGSSGSSGTASPATSAKAKNRAKARAVGDATRSWAKYKNERYNQLKTPRRKTLLALGASKAAATTSRFAGFRPRPAKRVWIKNGNVCISANGRTSGTWRSTPCPANMRWVAPK